MAYDVELTDTFGGEANYAWVRRAVVRSDDVRDDQQRYYRRAIMRRAKASVGLSGVRGRTEPFGDGYEFRPYGACMVLFVTWRDQPAD